MTFKAANELVATFHRHHKPVVGLKFAIGVCDARTPEKLLGAVIVGRPVARMVDHTKICEVARLVTDGTKNACSFLYASAARAAAAMGYEKIQTYILQEEPGTSLKAAGWIFEGNTSGGNWNHSWRKGRREDQPMCPKQRWSKKL